MSSWYSGVTNWLTDYVADPIAEVVGYVDDYADFDATEYSAGQQLVSDITDFADSDAFGFIQKGVKA